jgi:hypothetical protein
LWQGASPSANHLAIVFEEDTNSLIGAQVGEIASPFNLQLLLDLTQYQGRLLARRCLKSHPLVDALHITDFPTLAVFKRGERVPVLLAEWVLLQMFNDGQKPGVSGFEGCCSPSWRTFFATRRRTGTCN